MLSFCLKLEIVEKVTLLYGAFKMKSEKVIINQNHFQSKFALNFLGLTQCFWKFFVFKVFFEDFIRHNFC